MSVIQGQPSIMMGVDAGSLTDYTCAIRSFVINVQRNTVSKAPTPSNPAFEQKAGANVATVSIEFISDYVVSSGLWGELMAAYATDSAELYFEWIGADDTVSGTNPKITGFIVVTDLDTGVPVGQARRQSKTYPARDISQPITVP